MEHKCKTREGKTRGKIRENEGNRSETVSKTTVEARKMQIEMNRRTMYRRKRRGKRNSQKRDAAKRNSQNGSG